MEKVCIIGAGASGIVAAKVFHQRGIPFDCYEKGSGIGGNWRYLNDNGMSAAYRSLHINTSKQMMAYSDYPMPDDYPDYPHHSQILEYFERYVDHFGFRDRITFRTTVERVEPAREGGYHVTISDSNGQRTLHYRAVIVANGHHWSPRMPETPFPGQETFPGRQMHAHDYKVPEEFVDQNLLIVGFGNSAIDIACDTAHVAKHVFLAVRRGGHVIPKYVLGIPTDHLTNSPLALMPLWMQRLGMQLTVLLARGRQAGYGLPVPKHPILAEHPTVSSDILNYVGHGRVKIKPNIARIEGNRVHFQDGSSEIFDSIIYATGYNLCFPFLPPDVLKVENNQVKLYQQVVHPDHPGLFFIGLVQPLGAVMPLAEVQSKWLASLLSGEGELPDKSEMRRWIESHHREMARRYYHSPRHTIQVNFQPYLRGILKEIERGKARKRSVPH
jgi:dimethylaniline monooxygenase (N-oxide forming)